MASAAQQWEYLDVMLTLQGWTASSGESGDSSSIVVEQRGVSFVTMAPAFNQWGARGWELVAVVPTASDDSYRAYFRRPKQELQE